MGWAGGGQGGGEWVRDKVVKRSLRLVSFTWVCIVEFFLLNDKSSLLADIVNASNPF